MKLVDTAKPSTSKVPRLSESVNWNLCAVCQADSDESLQCPLNSTSGPVGYGYETFSRDCRELEFAEIGELPDNLLHLTNEESLRENKARWHKVCRAQFSKVKLQRIQKSLSKKVDHGCPGKPHTRSSASHPEWDEPTCFFCDKPGRKNEQLCEARTKEMDQNVRTAATYLGDSTLLSKLAAGDMIAIEAKYHTTCLCALYNRARPLVKRNQML